MSDLESLAEEPNSSRYSIVDTPAVRLYPKINGGESFVELLSGFASGNVATFVDGLHGSAEIVVANTQINHAHEHDHIDDRKRKTIYTTLSGMAAVAGGVAFAESTGYLQWGSDNIALDAVSWLAAGASATSAWFATRALVHRARIKYGSFRHAKLTETEHDISRHIIHLDTPSATLAFLSASARMASIALQGKGYGTAAEDLEHYVGMASGVWGAYLFRPTKNNLEHHSSEDSSETLPPAVEEMESFLTKHKRRIRKIGRRAISE